MFFLVCLFVWGVLGFKPSLLSMRGKPSVLEVSTSVWVSEVPALLSARNERRETATQQPDMWILSFSIATFRPSLATEERGGRRGWQRQGPWWVPVSSLSQGFSSGVRSLKKKFSFCRSLSPLSECQGWWGPALKEVCSLASHLAFPL